jgi:amino acid transporter
MITLNEEQKTARILQKANIIIAIIAFVPAFFCWLFTFDMWFVERQISSDSWATVYSSSEKIFFACASILLFIFYAYTIFCPLTHETNNYSKTGSGVYWIMVLITNLIAALLFVGVEFYIIAIVPAIPFLIAVDGLIAHHNIISNSKDSNEKIK